MALDFLLLYEHTVREYESDLLLKLELERRGYSCEIRQLLDRKKLRYFTWKKPRVLVSSNLYDNEGLNSHVYNNIGRCDRVVNLHWEQMLSDTQEEGDWFNMAGNAKKCVQTCWGKKTAERLQAHGMEAKNTPVTGAVMMDFLRPEFKGYFADKETLCRQFGLDASHKLHLYISSFGYASMTEAEVDELSRMAGTDFRGFAKTNRVSMQQTLDWFDRYLALHPEVELVYRRHPSEWNSPALEALAKKRPNFHVIFAGSVKDWIMAADSISDIDERICDSDSIMMRTVGFSIWQAHESELESAEDFERVHIARTIEQLVERSEVIQRALAEDRLMITGARYQLDTGKVEVLSF